MVSNSHFHKAYIIPSNFHNPTVTDSRTSCTYNSWIVLYKYLEKPKRVRALLHSWYSKVIRITANSVSCQLSDIWNGVTSKTTAIRTLKYGIISVAISSADAMVILDFACYGNCYASTNVLRCYESTNLLCYYAYTLVLWCGI